MNFKLWSRFLTLSLVAISVLLVLPALVAGQGKDTDFAGNYKGTAKMASGEMGVTLEIKSANGKFDGRAVAGDKEYKITSGKVTNGTLALTFGSGADVATLTLKASGAKLVGDWLQGTNKGTVELAKYDPIADVISGEWEAVADAGGQAVPFTLTLKLDGEKVTGSSNSQLGTANISTGTWKDGKLSIVLEGGSGQIIMAATIVEGKLSGDFDYAGQASGKWVAQKKK